MNQPQHLKKEWYVLVAPGSGELVYLHLTASQAYKQDVVIYGPEAASQMLYARNVGYLFPYTATTDEFEYCPDCGCDIEDLDGHYDDCRWALMVIYKWEKRRDAGAG